MKPLMVLSQTEFDDFDRFDKDRSHDVLLELIGGEAVVRLPGDGNHAYIESHIYQQLLGRDHAEPGAFGVSAKLGFATQHGRFIPDITVAELSAFEGETPWGRPEGYLMLIEIIATHRDTDRVDKRRAYAAAGIPLYLLIDRDSRESVLFSSPDAEAQDFRADIRVPFGADLPLPAPFLFTLTDFTPRTPPPREL